MSSPRRDANATQRDVAIAAKVSQATVSRTFDDPEAVLPATRELILKVAARLGYRSHASARAMRLGRSNQVAMIESSDPQRRWLPIRLLVGMQKALMPAGYHLLHANFLDDQLGDARILPDLLHHLNADGLLVNYTSEVPPAIDLALTKLGRPQIWLNVDRPTDCVRPDDRQAGQLLTSHLLAMGHRRIAYIDSVRNSGIVHVSRSDRQAGYQKAMAEAGLQDCVFTPGGRPYHELAGLDVFHAFLVRERPTACIGYASGDVGMVMVAALRSGLRLPQQLSLATFSEEPSFMGLSITTALVPAEEVGRVAVTMLLASIAQPRRKRPAQTLPFTIYAGNSCMPPG